MVEPELRVKEYVAAGEEFLYPAAGDDKPPGGAKVLLLTIGGVCIVGPWEDTGFYLGWCSLPKRNRNKESQIVEHTYRRS